MCSITMPCRIAAAIVFSLSSISLNTAIIGAQERSNLAPPTPDEEPDPRVELRAEATVPSVELNSRRAINDMTLLGEKPLSSEPPPAPVSQAVASQLRLDLEDAKADLAKTKELIGEIIQENKQLAESRELPPLKEAKLNVFYLRHIQPETASRMIASILGTEQLRLGYDAESRALIAAGAADQIKLAQSLIDLIDVAASAPKVAGSRGLASENDVPRSVMVRIFWLADGLPEGEGEDPADYLPSSVIDALARLKLSSARIVTHTENAASIPDNARVNFSAVAPATLFGQQATFACKGEVEMVSIGRSELQAQINVTGGPVSSELSGSATMTLGHYMVLGTANSLTPDSNSQKVAREKMLEAARAAARSRAEAEAGMGMPMGQGRGGEGFGMEGSRGGEMGRGMAMGGTPAVSYNASQFAFVVQVIEAESFEPGEEGQ